MASESKIDKLINQCRSNDVDVKVDALNKLQLEFESGAEVEDPEALLSVLKSCLRTSNQHLTNATLSALPQLFPTLISRPISTLPSSSISPSASTSSVASALIDTATLRQVLISFLPSGGLIERLGDKEKAQAKAREALVILGGFAFRSGSTSAMSARAREGKGPETPLMIFERFLRESGLASKVWKVREQSILTLLYIRRLHHLFPVRPYLTLLVECLEDTDAHVRECSRQSIVELFSGPGVTDAARADLKKEMTKKGVRKTIVDGVLSKLLGGSSALSNPQSREGSESGDSAKAKDYVPPSLALQGKKPRVASQPAGMARVASQANLKELSRPGSRAASPPPLPTPASENVDIQSVYIASTRDLESEFADMAKPFEGKESEHNWAAREQAILRVRGMLKGDVHIRYADAFMACLKDGFMQWSLKTLASLRTTVASNTTSLYSEFAFALGSALDPYCELLLTNLLKMAGFTKKITAQQSQLCVTNIISQTSPQPRIVLPLLWGTLQEKIVQARAHIVAHIKQYIEVHGQRSKAAIEHSGGLDILEKSLKKALADPNPAVKEAARVLFWVFEDVWHDRGLAISETLDPTARKQLEKACPNPQQKAALPPSTPTSSKKSSVAAAIAASRAKAKAIASAPPSLRHQATSASHAPPSRRAGSPSALSMRSTGPRPASPLRMSTSPSSPSSPRTMSNMSRSVSSSAVLGTHARHPSGDSARSVSPCELSTARRRTSSPLSTTSANRGSNIRKALEASSPVSLPSSTGHASPTTRNGNGNMRNTAVPLPKQQRPVIFTATTGVDDALLIAQTIPIPEGDTDSEDDNSVNLMSFSAPFEMFPPILPTVLPKFNSQPLPPSPKSNNSRPATSISNALSSDSILDGGAGQPVVEDALRARAEQAESAAERLLELVEPEEASVQYPILPASLLVGNGNGNGHVAMKIKAKPTPIPVPHSVVMQPVTPDNRASVIMRQAAMFKDSPVYNGRSSSLLDVLQGRKQETGWWLRKQALFARATTASNASVQSLDLEGYINGLISGSADALVLQEIALLCIRNPIAESSPPSPGADPLSPSPFTSSRSLYSLQSDMWESKKAFERLFNSLVKYLEETRTDEEMEYGLIIIWEMLECQAPYLEGREAELFSMLLHVRYNNQVNVLEATSTIRDALTAKLDPVYGLTTIHACLRTFYAEAPPTTADEEIKAATYAFGLIALGKFILRLPAEIAEEELPRLKGTLISSLNDRTSLIVRESAAASIIAAQLVLRDETHLFALLDGLADEKKNLLTYLFDKHGVRGLAASAGSSGMDRLEKEIRRLDKRTSTPSRA